MYDNHYLADKLKFLEFKMAAAAILKFVFLAITLIDRLSDLVEILYAEA